MKKVIVIGGGFAGLAAACYLAEKGIKVELLESSPKLGGRAYSFHDKTTNDLIDNGQHLLMGCYRYTLNFLKKIGAEKNIEEIYPLNLCYVESGGRQFDLKVQSNIYPFNLISALLRLRAISFRNRLRLLIPFASLLLPIKHKNKSIENWLEGLHQNDEIISRFWELLSISTMNALPSDVSAESFKRILKIIFLNGNKNSSLIIPKLDLSSMYVYFARDFIEKYGGKIRLSESVEEFKFESNKIIKIITSKRKISDFDNVVLAVPSFAAAKLLPGEFNPLKDCTLKYSPIMTLHLWLKNNPFTERIYGLLGSNIHWVFNHDKHISLVTSGADKFINVDRNEIIEKFIQELSDYFPVFYPALVTHKHLVIEKRAAFVETPDVEVMRGKIESKVSNLLLAGDWTNTKLPSTIEGAVKSGYKAAEKFLEIHH